jgi:hypothetical protein
MRAFLLISAAALGLAACGTREADEANMADANLTMEENIALDPALNADANMATDNMVDENATTNADTNTGNSY